MTIQKHFLLFCFWLASAHLLAGGLSLSFSESMRSPLDELKPTDYEVTFYTKYNDNIDLYYCQERDNGINQRDYWLMLQRQVWKSLWLSVKRQENKDNDLWMADIKLRLDAAGWKTFFGYSNCWEHGIYRGKLLLEEQKEFNFNFFLTPFDIVLYTKLLADMDKFYHEEKVEVKFLVNLPANWKLSKYINTYVKLFVLSKDFGFYRWQQKLMLEVNFK